MSHFRSVARPGPFNTAVFLLLLCSLGGSFAAAQETARELRGTVVAEDSGRPVRGAVATLVELGRRTTTDDDGNFVFSGVPRGGFTLGVHALSFASWHQSVALPSEEPIRVVLKPDSHFSEEVTVTAAPSAISPLEAAQSVDLVDQLRIKREGNNSVGEALAHVPGLANIGTGDALGTPVIRGTSENRVRVMNGGVPVNHQQWSFRHSPNIEPLFAERIEVVRGPASVMWGPDAMGGVINMVYPPLPAEARGKSTFHGEAGLGYFSNNGQGQGQVMLEGAAGSFGWRAAVVRRDTGDIVTPRRTLDNTDYRQTNGNVALGYTATWGSARLRWNHWDDDVGFFFPAGRPSHGFRLGLEDDTLAADAVLPTAAGDVDVLISHQANSRRAFDPAAPAYPEAAVDLELKTTTARVGFDHRRLGAWKGRFAAEYRGIENETLASNLLPDYSSDGYSLMALEEARFLGGSDRDLDRLILSLGLRWDSSNLRVPVDPTQPAVPDGFDQTYHSATGSIGLVYRATGQFSIAGSLGRGWRPPNAFELFARGVHGGIAAFQLGNPDLTEESNFSAELSLRYQSRHWRAVLTGYRSEFADFIYLLDTGEIEGDSGLPIFGYAQADAASDGVEASFEVVPLEQLQLGLIYSHVSTRNDATGRRLPQTPPDRVNLIIRGMAQQLGPLVAPFAELELLWVDDGVPSGPDEPYFASGNAATESYALLHLKAGLQLGAGPGLVGIDLTLRNLLDTEYTDFLYPYKGFGVLNPGRDLRLLARFQF